jgi:aminomethyltransferase
MFRTPLYDRQAAMGARMGEYCGAETAMSFSEPRTEYLTLLTGCGVYDLGWRARFRISGNDRVRWLNGMVSNNIRELSAGRGNYNFALSPQGHVQADLYVYNCGEYFLAGTERSQFEKLLALLRRYIIMDHVELTDISDEFTAIGIQGPNAAGILAKAGIEGTLPEALVLKEVVWKGQKLLATRMASEQFLTYEIWVPPAMASSLWDALTAAGATPVGMDALEMFRITTGVPRYGLDIRERDLPQETGQMQALNFSKGCYIGQEIVERIRSRGNVHRCFTGFQIDGDLPATGSKVMFDGKDVGEITSALRVPVNADEERTLALGYVRREAAKPGTQVQINGTAAMVSSVPFPEISSTAS